MLSYKQVNDADLSGIEEAAQEWRRLRTAYEGLGDRYKGQVQGPLKAHWEGEAAESAQSRVSRVKQQIDAAAGEAARMAKLLDDIGHDLRAHKKRLRRWQDDVHADHFTVSEDGTLTSNHPRDKDASGNGTFVPEPTDSIHAPSAWTRQRQNKAEAYATDLRAVLQAATTTDTEAAAALRSDPNGGSRGFNAKGYESVEAARDADRAARLMKVEDPTPTQLDELNKLLAKHKTDAGFASDFAQSVPPRQLNQTYSNILFSMNDSPQERQLAKKLQQNLGETVGTATRVDTPAMDRYKKELIALGNEEFVPEGMDPLNPDDPVGWQVTGSLMAHGDWDDDFMVDYGERLVEADLQRRPGHVEFFSEGWPDPPGLLAQDPFSGYLDGLGHSPDAATRFLGGTSQVDSDGGGDGMSRVDNFDYLMEKRDWPQDEDRAHLGHALHAGVTGHAYDASPPPQPPVPHSAENAKLMEEVVRSVSDHEQGMDRAAPMAESLGKMSAEYMADINGGLMADQEMAEKIHPPNGERAHFLLGNGTPDSDMVTRFLYNVSREPDGHSAIVAGQHAYAESLINYHAHRPDAYDPGIPGQEVKDIAQSVGVIDGIAASAKSDTVIHDGMKDDREFNSALERSVKWTNAGVSTIGAGFGVGGAAGSEAVKIGIEEIGGSLKETDYGDAKVAADRETVNDMSETHHHLQERLQQGFGGKSADLPPDGIRSVTGEGLREGRLEAGRLVSRVPNRPEDAQEVKGLED